MAGTSWGCSTKLLNDFRRAFIETTTTYGSAAYATLGRKSYVDKLEVARNEASRVTTGCLKTTKISRLRALLGARTLSHTGLQTAAMEVEKSLRGSNTPLRVQIHMHGEQRLKGSRSLRNECLQRIADLGILSLTRVKQPGPPTPDTSSQRFTTHITPISAETPNDEKQQTARTFIKELEDRNQADINVWTDGSLITTPTETYQELHVGERVSVIWDDGWYCGTITHAHGDCPTTFRIQYDDGDTFWYQTSSTNDRVLIEF